MAEAINIAPSQYWEGNDGLWSTFAIQIGNPPQTVRVLPSTSGSSIWAVLPEGCSAPEDPADCAEKRGVLFDPSNSTTWQRVGDANRFFELPYETEASLGYEGNAIIGYDNVELGWPGAGGPVLESQVIAGYAAKDSMLGLLGLTPRPVNITSYVDRKPSPLGTLVNVNRTVPSSYWAYTAGAQYRTPRTLGSLVFGGYDSLRGDLGNGLVVPISADTNRDLVVAISSISITTPSFSSNVTVNGLPVLALLSSVAPDIWLPLAACQVFEAVFGLSYNSTASRYFISDAQHASLLAQNSSVTFSLAPSATSPGSAARAITLPYAAFDLTASYPVGGLGPNGTSRYFPLRIARNATQITLGRAFLQEAYLSVDYTRNEFRLTQALFPQDSTASQLVSISDPNRSSSSSSLSAGAIAGIIIGIVLLLLLLGLGFFFYRRRSKRRAAALPATRSNDEAASSTTRRASEEVTQFKPELDASTTAIGRDRGKWELDGQESSTATPSDAWSPDEKHRFGANGGVAHNQCYEMPDHMVNEAPGNDGAFETGGRVVLGELDSRQRVELDAGGGDDPWRRGAVELPAERYD